MSAPCGDLAAAEAKLQRALESMNTKAGYPRTESLMRELKQRLLDTPNVLGIDPWASVDRLKVVSEQDTEDFLEARQVYKAARDAYLHAKEASDAARSVATQNEDSEESVAKKARTGSV